MAPHKAKGPCGQVAAPAGRSGCTPRTGEKAHKRMSTLPLPRRAFITGTGGFIGFHLAELLLQQGWHVTGYDGMTDYYDVTLKERRHAILAQHPEFVAHIAMLENMGTLSDAMHAARPDVVIHLAAQAGVRYSLENPRAYIDANILGTFNVMEAARALQVGHLMMASTASVYGVNEKLPFAETDKADSQITLYSATKKANEAMAHSYAHIYRMPTTVFRFFSAYGPWGRPDMALFKFTRGILEGTPIDIYNHGDMWRDFTYVSDLVRAIAGLIPALPPQVDGRADIHPADSLSPVGPFRIVNIGNSDMIRLQDFITAIEEKIGRPAVRNYMPMQTGDVPRSWADTTLLQSLTGYRPQTDFRVGVGRFVDWYRDYYQA
jgi:UDP-glucuronate 4-epimerase